MFNVSKKTLSVVLCLALLVSVVAVCFVSPVSAETTVPSSVSLDFSTPLTPTQTHNVSYDFSGQNMHLTASGNARLALEELKVLLAGRKYYISFDAKTVSGAECTDFNFIIGGSDTTAYRVFLSWDVAKQAMVDSGSKFYVNGVEKSSYDDFNKPTTEWTHYGFTLNLDSAVWESVFNNENAYPANRNGYFTTQPAYLSIGAGTANGKQMYYDNFSVISVDSYSNSVPGTEPLPEYKVTVVVEHDMDTETADSLINTGSVSFPAETGRGNVLKVSSGRSAFKDSQVIEVGKKYTVTFDAKADSAAYPVFVLASETSTADPRFFISDASGSATENGKLNQYFEFYKGGNKYNVTTLFSNAGLQIGTTWESYKIVIDYTNEELIELTNLEEGDAYRRLAKQISYFYIGGNGVYYDNFKIVETSDVTPDSTTRDFEIEKVNHDMDTETTDALINGSVASFVDEAGRGKVLKVSSNRVAFNDSQVIKAGKKYVITFDARSDASSAYPTIMLASETSTADPRTFLYNESGGCTSTTLNSYLEFYIGDTRYSPGDPNGEYAKGYGFGSDWQSYKIVIDYTNEDLITLTSTPGPAYGELATITSYFYIGGTNVYYDNLVISEVATITPGGSKVANITKVNHDMETESTSNLISTGSASFVDEAGRGRVLKVASGRSAFKDSQVIKAGKKYVITFDGRSDASSAYPTIMLASETSTADPRTFLYNESGGCTSTTLNSYLEFYVGDVRYSPGDPNGEYAKGYGFGSGWQSYTIVIDYTNEDLIALTNTGGDAYGKLATITSYFYIGGTNVYIDNLVISEEAELTSIESTQISNRNASGSGDSYISAGLRFKDFLPNEVAEAAEEIGFVVLPSVYASVASNTWYLPDGAGHEYAQTVKCKQDGSEIIYAKDSKNSYYQVVLTGLSTESGKTAYGVSYSAVMYTRVGSTYTYYGLSSASYRGVEGVTSVIKSAPDAQ